MVCRNSYQSQREVRQKDLKNVGVPQCRMTPELADAVSVSNVSCHCAPALTFNFSIVFDPLIVELGGLLQTLADNSFNLFWWNWGHNVLHQDLQEKKRDQHFTLAFVIIIISGF